MADATLISEKTIGNMSGVVEMYKFEIPSVGAGVTSPEYVLTLPGLENNDGMIDAFTVVNASTSFDISVRSKTGVISPSIEEILSLKTINQFYTEGKMGLYFRNEDSAPTNKLYVIIKNNAGVPTGVIGLRFVILV
jgi:hypothetical protein